MSMAVWETVTGTLAAEFSDLGDAAALTQLVVRMLVAAILGGILGMQREHAGKAAGVRTHMLLCMAAALFVLVPQQVGFDEESLSRVAQGLLAGVGLLCAGVILKSDTNEDVRGLTTGAGMWMTTAIGVAVGLGREGTAALATLLALAVLALEGPLDGLARRGRGRER